MGLNLAAIAAGYQGAKDEQRRIADDERRAKADARADQDAAFSDEQRGRLRADWKEADRLKAADKADIAAVREQFAPKAAADTDVEVLGAAQQQAQQQVDAENTQAQIDRANAAPTDGIAESLAAGAAPGAMAKAPNTPTWLTSAQTGQPATSPKIAPEVAAKVQAIATPKGMPKVQDFNNSLAMQSEMIRRKVARGDMSPEDYAQKMGVLTKMKNEGVNDALALMAQGRYDDAMERYNSTGAMSGARVIKGVEGTTKINGEDVPTHFVTVRNADGSTTTMDVARAQYQLLDINQRLAHVDRASQTAMQREHYAGTLALTREQMAQQAKDAAASRGIQAAHLNLARLQFNASTPLGQLEAIEKGLGTTLTPEQRATKLGVDALPVASRALVTSLLKEQDQISQSLNKAQSEGTWQPESPGAKQLTMRSAELNLRLADLLSAAKRPGAAADPLERNSPAAGTVTKPSNGPAAVPPPGGTQAAPAAQPRRQLIQAPGGARPPAAPDVPSYEGWRAAKQRLDDVNAAATNMSAGQAEIYLAARLPELEAAVQFQSNYKKY